MCTCSCRPVFCILYVHVRVQVVFFLAVKIRTTRRVFHPTSETVRVQDAAVLLYTGKKKFDIYSSTDCIVESVTQVGDSPGCCQGQQDDFL